MFLERITSWEDPARSMEDLVEICALVNHVDGADCDSAQALLQLRSDSPQYFQEDKARRRFSCGSVDEVSFVGPDVGVLDSVLVGLEQGSWGLAELTVSSSSSKSTTRFLCRGMIGTNSRWGTNFSSRPRAHHSDGGGAVQLVPIPTDLVLYGDRAVTSQEAQKLRESSMVKYSLLKDRAAIGTAALVTGGTIVCALVGGSHVATPFLAGGVLGIFYQQLLQNRVDQLGKGLGHVTTPLSPPDEATATTTATSTGRRGGGGGGGGGDDDQGRGDDDLGMNRKQTVRIATRLLLFFAAAFIGYNSLDTIFSTDVEGAEDLPTFVTMVLGLGGFLQHKVALTLSALAEQDEQFMADLASSSSSSSSSSSLAGTGKSSQDKLSRERSGDRRGGGEEKSRRGGESGEEEEEGGGSGDVDVKYGNSGGGSSG